MKFNSRYSLTFMSILIFLQSKHVVTGFTGFSDYLTKIKTYFIVDEPETYLSDEFNQKIPYEVSTVDEKFISEAAKLTGVALSELDTCQQRVVLKLRSDCDKMNDEQLAKMAVHLLNCQSYVEGRPIFPCTDDMSIRDCTSNMDSDTWTSYHLMSNRARAVCYSIRQIQFRGLAEHTVNRLMDVARGQLTTLSEISQNQHNLKELAEDTLTSLSEGHNLLANQQKDLQSAQFHGQLVIEDNIRKLAQEKDLIISTHDQLVQMTHKIQKKLEDSSQNLEKHGKESRQNHQELLDDLVAIQDRAQAIFQRIEESSQMLLEQNENLKQQYQETLRNLAEVNKTVHNLVTLVGGTRQALEERLTWLTTALGGTDLTVERLYVIIWHSAFMLVSMLTCAFLSAKLTTRMVVAMVPPLNLILALWRSENQLGPLTLTGTVLSFVLGQAVLLWAFSMRRTIRGALQWPKSPVVDKTKSSEPNNVDEPSLDLHEEEDYFDLHDLGSPTPPHSRNSFYKPRSRSRSSTPLIINGGSRGVCHAKTRVGTPCKLTSLPGRAYCYRHQSGDSVMGS